MRSAALGLLVSVVALAGAGAVVASPQFAATLEFTYSSQTPNSPSGFDSFATWSDPGEPHGKPKELQRIKVVFHPGTRLDTSALPRCRATDEQIQRLGVRACPASAKLGNVHATGMISTGQPFNPVATLFNAKREIVVVVNIEGGRQLTFFRDDVRRRSITVNLKIPRGVSLTTFRPHISRHLGKRGKRRRAYMRTPPTCPPSGFWTTAVTFSYRDGSSQTLSVPSPCRKA